MAKKWNTEDTELIRREVLKPTITNKKLAEQLGRTLQSIVSKKRTEEERMKQFRAWSEEEDAKLLESPPKSEFELSVILGRSKKDVHERRELFQKQRQQNKDVAAKEPAVLKAEPEKKRVSIEQCTVVLNKATEKPVERPETLQAASEAEPIVVEETIRLKEELSQAQNTIQRMEKQIEAARAAMSVLKCKNFSTIREFTIIMDYILGEETTKETDNTDS